MQEYLKGVKLGSAELAKFEDRIREDVALLEEKEPANSNLLSAYRELNSFRMDYFGRVFQSAQQFFEIAPFYTPLQLETSAAAFLALRKTNYACLASIQQMIINELAGK